MNFFSISFPFLLFLWLFCGGTKAAQSTTIFSQVNFERVASKSYESPCWPCSSNVSHVPWGRVFSNSMVPLKDGESSRHPPHAQALESSLEQALESSSEQQH